VTKKAAAALEARKAVERIGWMVKRGKNRGRIVPK
jgi:hypothetical protein